MLKTQYDIDRWTSTFDKMRRTKKANYTWKGKTYNNKKSIKTFLSWIKKNPTFEKASEYHYVERCLYLLKTN